MKHNEVMDRLRCGNRAYVAGAPVGDYSPEHRRALVAGQSPFAVVITCSDSRVVPEAVFSCGAGELFVVRSAGNVVDDACLASVCYAVEHLGVGTVVLMGHSHCGAVAAALHGETEGRVGAITRRIMSVFGGETNADKATRLNVANGVRTLRAAFHADIVGAVYDLYSGEVDFLQ